jgi:hypothetical protein
MEQPASDGSKKPVRVPGRPGADRAWKKAMDELDARNARKPKP